MALTHLHVHSHYSLLRGLPKIADLIKIAADHRLNSLALTDGPGLYGAVEFYVAAKAAGLKPIIGLELPVAVGFDGHAKKKELVKVILLAKSKTGYLNLIQLSTKALTTPLGLEAPHVTVQDLERHKDELVVIVSFHQDNPLTSPRINKLKNIIADGDLYLELQIHQTDPANDRLTQQLLKLAEETTLPVAAANTVLYLKPADAQAQAAVTCIDQKIKLSEYQPPAGDRSFLSLKQLRETFKDYPEALANLEKIEAACNLQIPINQWEFPRFPLPDNVTADQVLREQAYAGLRQRLGQLKTENQERLDYELEIIKNKGYATYFLVVSDIINWAKQQGIATTTRGSAAGSLVSYAIGITTINPLDYNLPFERFLNPYRPSLPDIDMDFGDNRREEVYDYVKKKYGADHVAQIATFGTMQARAAVRDVGRALGYSYGFCDRIAKLIPLGKQGFPMTIDKALSLTPELQEMYDNNEEVAQLLDLARQIEGNARHVSIHAAGVVISAGPLTDYVPLQLETGGTAITTQYDMVGVEQAGLVKMDFLGIRNLTILEQAAKLASLRHNLTIDLEKIPLNDPKTFALLARGETMGLFQLNGSGLTKYLKELKPTRIEDIMAMVALYRPGPIESIPDYIDRKHHPEKIKYLDPRLKDILDKSYGVLVYQDDVLLTAIHLAGYNWEEADKLRKAMGKKIPAEMAKQKDKFIAGCIGYGSLSQAQAEELWRLIEPFAAYGFNKAHACSYGMVAYQTAYLKANYPVEYMTAVMTAESGDNETIAEAVAECKRLGIKVLPPALNHSQAGFTVDEDSVTKEAIIRFGLTAIKNVGQGVVETIVRERETNGPYHNLTDFLERASGKDLNKKSLECLVKTGAFDDGSFGERQQLLDNLETILQYHRHCQEAKKRGQNTLFGAASDLPSLTLSPSEAASPLTKANWEKELLGIYLTYHHLSGYEEILPANLKHLRQLPEIPKEQLVLVAGLLTAIRIITTKNNETMLFAQITDQTGQTELVVFPKTLANTRDCWSVGNLLLVEAKVSDKGNERKLLVNRAKRLPSEPPKGKIQTTPSGQGQPLWITITDQPNPLLIQRLHELLSQAPGQRIVHLRLSQTGKNIKTNYRVNLTSDLKSNLIKLLGQEALA